MSDPPRAPDKRANAARWIGFSFCASALGSIGLTVVYGLGGQPQLEGTLLAIALGGIATGLGLWALQLLPPGPFIQHRDVVPHQKEARREAEETFESGAEPIARRGFIAKALGAAVVALGAAALFPIRSLGTRPGRSLFETEWAPGTRLVTRAGIPVRADMVEVGGVLTVFPEDRTEAADSQVLLIRLQPGEYDAPEEREDWSPEGFIAFSKICTHAGCPVGLYQSETHELFCPCHQSVFAVLQGAEPTSGPATRPLPQLPLDIDEGGYLTATGDFAEPVGPGFWSRGRA
jgi:ubiquinol-cytochrome c reductase iron-sulfur subunit